jgi:hypothetical protein
MGKKKICCGGFEIGDGLELKGKQLNVVGGGNNQITIKTTQML